MIGELLASLATMPDMPHCACRSRHRLWDAALTDRLAAETARDICLTQCPCLVSCTAWAASLTSRQRSELGVLAGTLPGATVADTTGASTTEAQARRARLAARRQAG